MAFGLAGPGFICAKSSFVPPKGLDCAVPGFITQCRQATFFLSSPNAQPIRAGCKAPCAAMMPLAICGTRNRAYSSSLSEHKQPWTLGAECVCVGEISIGLVGILVALFERCLTFSRLASY